MATSLPLSTSSTLPLHTIVIAIAVATTAVTTAIINVALPLSPLASSLLPSPPLFPRRVVSPPPPLFHHHILPLLIVECLPI
jgi:hypothetical protein